MSLKPHIVCHRSRDQIFLQGWSQGTRLAKSTVAPISRLFLPVIKEASSLGLVVRASLITGMEYGMERWNGKWNGTVNVHSCS